MFHSFMCFGIFLWTRPRTPERLGPESDVHLIAVREPVCDEQDKGIKTGGEKKDEWRIILNKGEGAE